MFTALGSWELASLLAKLLLYMGAVSIAGGALSNWHYSSSNQVAQHFNLSYILVGSTIGFQGAALGFLVQVGSINDRGIGGMFDWEMISILLDTSQGDVTFFRLLAFVVTAGTALFALRRGRTLDLSSNSTTSKIVLCFLFAGLILLAHTHRIIGHVSILGNVAQLAIIAHFITFAAWIGCLLPFLYLSKSLDVNSLQHSLKNFGNNAVVILLVLFLTAGLLLLELLNSPMELFSTDYGLALLAKIILVLAILFIAAINKIFLVPALIDSGSVKKLQLSLRCEIFLAVMILLITAYLSTIVGPADHAG